MTPETLAVLVNSVSVLILTGTQLRLTRWMVTLSREQAWTAAWLGVPPRPRATPGRQARGRQTDTGAGHLGGDSDGPLT